MNAAARVIHQNNVFTGHWTSLRISKIQSFLMFFLTCLLLNAVAVIYATSSVRFSMNELEHLNAEAHELNIERGQLLLEQAALSTPARIEKLATKELNMHLPAEQATVLLRM